MKSETSIEAFTIRVYGLLIHEGQILLSRENIYGGIYLKFPGGGLEFGEGSLECLKREFMEETNLTISPGQHFYTTDVFVPSAFSSKIQVMSIYYYVHCDDLSPLLSLSSRRELAKHGDQELVWKPLAELQPEELNLSIDRLVAQRLIEA